MPQKKAKVWQRQLQNPNNAPVMSQEARKRIMTFTESPVESPYGFTARVQRVAGIWKQVYVE